MISVFISGVCDCVCICVDYILYDLINDNRGFSSVGRASDSSPEGHQFKSGNPHINFCLRFFICKTLLISNFVATTTFLVSATPYTLFQFCPL